MSDQKEVICNLLNMAKHDEKKAAKDYNHILQLASLFDEQKVRETIDEIKRDEEDHHRKIVKLLESCGPEPRAPSMPGLTYISKDLDGEVREKLSSEKEARELAAIHKTCAIQLEEPDNWPGTAYEIRNLCTDKTIIVQHDGDFPSLAENFGWDMGDKRKKKYDYGTLDERLEVIGDAIDWLDEHIGAKAEDPGYFED